MQFRDFLVPAILDDLAARTRDEVLSEMTDALIQAEVLAPESRESVLSALRDRERLASTAIGKNTRFAIPHAKHPSVRKLTGLFARSREGVPYGSPDGESVRLFMLLLSNHHCADKHLDALAYAIKQFRDPDFRRFLLNARDREQIAEFLDDADQRD